MEELISIIIPAYNAEKTIEKCLRSIINQSYKDIQLIIVNDGSTDCTASICEQYLDIDNRIELINLSNAGVSNARNVGLKISKGEYILFVDADDWLPETALEILYKNIENTDIVVGSYKRLNYYRSQDYIVPNIKYTFPDEGDFLKYIHLGNLRTPWAKLFRKEILEKIEFDIDLPYAEDSIFVLQALRNCKSIKMISDIVYYYDCSSLSGASHRFDHKITTYIERLFCEYCKTVKKMSNNSKKNAEFQNERAQSDIKMLVDYYCQKKTGFSKWIEIEDLKQISDFYSQYIVEPVDKNIDLLLKKHYQIVYIKMFIAKSFFMIEDSIKRIIKRCIKSRKNS